MAESAIAPPTLSEQYHLEKEPKPDIEIKSPTTAASEEVVSPKTEETAASPESVELAPAASEESSEASDAAAVESNEAGETASAADEESSENTEQQTAGDEEFEQTPEIKLETAPADYRFPTTNQSRHCFTRYIEYHRCIAAKGEGALECDKFAKYYRSLCPGEWVDRWNEQRENGTFPGPL